MLCLQANDYNIIVIYGDNLQRHAFRDVVIISENENERYKNNMQVKLYNKATKTVVQSDEWTVSDEDTHIRTTIWGTDLTVAMPVGVYAIDVIDEDMGDMLYHNDNHARCIATSESLQS